MMYKTDTSLDGLTRRQVACNCFRKSVWPMFQNV